MYTVYILLSKKDRSLYVGCTKEITKRLESHNKGFVTATKHRIPYVAIYTELYENKADAFQRERFLKSLWSARFKKKLKDTYLLKNSFKI